MQKITKSFSYGDHQVTIETGELARQATGSVLVNVEGTVVLVTVVAVREVTEGRDFFSTNGQLSRADVCRRKDPRWFFSSEREGPLSMRF